MLLLSEAVKGNYDYYHLLSGADIPLKSVDEIESFFEQTNSSFIQYSTDQNQEQIMDHVRYYLPLQNFLGRPQPNPDWKRSVLEQIAYELIKLQRALGIDRTKKRPFDYYKGGNWFSIKHNLAAYVVEHRQMVRRYFYWGMTADEMFMQCMAKYSPYKDEIVNDNLRLIDWNRKEHDGCSPHTFTSEDLPMLLGSDKLWARKFNPDIDGKIIDLLYERLKNNQKR